MNVVVYGPFGLGSLADDALLAGFLAYLKFAKHEITVLTPNPDAVIEMFDVEAIQLASPLAILSAPQVWDKLSKAHLFIVSSAGSVNEKGELPARQWLGTAEHARRAGPRTAIMSIGAVKIPDLKERVRVQRQLHNFTDYISARDADSKNVVIGYGISATRVSHNGDFTLALTQQKVTGETAHREKTAGLVLSPQAPTRGEFGFTAVPFSADFIAAYREVLKSLLEKGRRVRLFHDDTDLAREAAKTICDELDDEHLDVPDVGDDIETTRERMAACGVIFSPSLHGAILASTCSVPPIVLAAEPGAALFAASLGLSGHVLTEFTADAVMKVIEETLAKAAVISEQVAAKVQSLLKKQTQDARTLELLVPRRDRRPPRADDVEKAEDAEGSKGKAAKAGAGRAERAPFAKDRRGTRGAPRPFAARGASRRKPDRGGRKKSDDDPWFSE